MPRVISVDEPSDEIREVKIGDEDFQNCADTKIELQCYESKVGSFVSIQNFTTTSFSVKPYLEKTCRIRYELWFLCQDEIFLFVIGSGSARDMHSMQSSTQFWILSLLWSGF